MVKTSNHHRTRKRVKVVKNTARPELKDFGWDALGLAKDMNLSQLIDAPDQIARIDGRKVPTEDFIRNYENPRKPVIITGLIDTWPAKKKWNFERFERKFRNQLFKCGEDDEGYSVKMKMKYYLDYMATQNDDSPLYIFDSSFGERRKTKKLQYEYVVPPYFEDDLFSYVSPKRRPPYRWFVMGPARSGTGIHIDPLGTSAWNGLVVGRKKWVMIPPEVPKALVKPPSEVEGKHPDEATTWFNHVYPILHEKKGTDAEIAFFECVQQPGEIVFVPSGWWHVVINLENTIAVTQNFCSLYNLDVVWRKTKRGRPKMYRKWMETLTRERPEAIDLINQYMEKESEGGCGSDGSSCSSSSSSSSSESESENEGDVSSNCSSRSSKAGSPRRVVSDRKRRASCSHDDSECACKLRRSP